jgi:starch synthase
LLVAAENGALPGGKVGGIGDVIRELPPALAELGWRPTVLTPSYGMLHALAGAVPSGRLDVSFAGSVRQIPVFRVPGPDPRVEHLVLEHPLFCPAGPGKIYCDDPPQRPFATDASKFALFSAAVAGYVREQSARPGIVHLHDWHAALYLALREFDPSLRELQDLPTVFTIHNLALQGIRPLRNDASALESWFPDLRYDYDVVKDPRYGDCVNPMALAIRLADRVNTVSPSYAREILLPDDLQRGFHGGEGLETDLRRAHEEARLVGILNGCDYPGVHRPAARWSRFVELASAQVASWRASDTGDISDHLLAAGRLSALGGNKPPCLLTSIGRLTEQKVALFLEPLSDGRSALQAILDKLGGQGVLVLLGSGNRDLERQIAAIARQRENLLFLRGYSEGLPDLVYELGDLFLMPSSFEPCGISQMLAMREGQPCVVHAVGGLKDTVRDGVNGFAFAGETPLEQAENFVSKVDHALALMASDAVAWERIRKRAAAERFSWAAAARKYDEELYGYFGL